MTRTKHQVLQPSLCQRSDFIYCWWCFQFHSSSGYQCWRYSYWSSLNLTFVKTCVSTLFFSLSTTTSDWAPKSRWPAQEPVLVEVLPQKTINVPIFSSSITTSDFIRSSCYLKCCWCICNWAYCWWHCSNSAYRWCAYWNGWGHPRHLSIIDYFYYCSSTLCFITNIISWIRSQWWSIVHIYSSWRYKNDLRCSCSGNSRKMSKKCSSWDFISTIWSYISCWVQVGDFFAMGRPL